MLVSNDSHKGTLPKKKHGNVYSIRSAISRCIRMYQFYTLPLSSSSSSMIVSILVRGL